MQGNSVEKRYGGERRTLIIMAAFFATTLLLGTFLDETIARALFSPQNVVATLITTLGIYPFSAAVVLFLGVACERVAHTAKTTLARVAGIAVTALTALAVGFLGARSLVDGDCLGSIIPALYKNTLASAVICLALMMPMFGVGFRLAGKSTDRLLLKKAVCLVIILLATFAFLQVTKGIFNRPRFRVVAQGLPGVGFVPWHTISPSPADLMAQHGLEANEFRSFPSGHAILSISAISILLSLAWLVPSLADKRLRLMWAGFGFALIIMFTRMLLGAHYLSDVSAGGLIGLAFVALNHTLQQRFEEGR